MVSHCHVIVMKEALLTLLRSSSRPGRLRELRRRLQCLLSPDSLLPHPDPVQHAALGPWPAAGSADVPRRLLPKRHRIRHSYELRIRSSCLYFLICFRPWPDHHHGRLRCLAQLHLEHWPVLRSLSEYIIRCCPLHIRTWTLRHVWSQQRWLRCLWCPDLYDWSSPQRWRL
jgi:hypothetical protein